MSRHIVSFSFALLLVASALANPADLIIEAEGLVFVERGGETLTVEECPFVLELGDVLLVSPDARAVLPGEEAAGSTELTVEDCPRTFSEARPLIAMMLTENPLETARAGGVDFTTMRSGIHLSHQLQSPRNTTLLAAPEALTVALPSEAADAFLADMDDAELSASLTVIVFGADDPLLTETLTWSRADLEALLQSGEEADLRTIDLTGIAERIPEGAQVVTVIESPQIQALALELEPTSPPPIDRAWFEVMDAEHRTQCESEIANVRALTERLNLPPVNQALYEARVLFNHGMTNQTLDLLDERLTSLSGQLSEEDLAPLQRFHENLLAEISQPWTPGDN